MVRKSSSRSFIIKKTAKTPAFSRSAMRWILATSESVQVTYELTKTATLSLLDDGFFIGGTVIDLASDKKSANAYTSQSSYLCIAVDGKLTVELQADGFVGDSWTLKILVNGKQLDDFPIVEQVKSGGRADHDQDHLFQT